MYASFVMNAEIVVPGNGYLNIVDVHTCTGKMLPVESTIDIAAFDHFAPCAVVYEQQKT